MNRKRKEYDRVGSGVRIQNRRQELNMTQDELGSKIDRASKYVSDIERGKCGMSLETAISFAEALSTSVDYLIFGENTPAKASRDEDAKIGSGFESIQDVNDFFYKSSAPVREQLLKLVSAFASALEGSE